MSRYYERHLPHYQPDGYTYFVTFRLANSLPTSLILQLMEERKINLERIAAITDKAEKTDTYHKYQSTYFNKFDDLLDKNNQSPCWLKIESVARIVFNSLRFYEGKKYDLIAFTIMPNHVHLIFTPLVKKTGRLPSVIKDHSDCVESIYNVTDILRSIKRFTALECNKALHRSGAFWHSESYDHVIRNEHSLNKLTKYILNNPVKAGLCNTPEACPWNYCKYS